MIEAVIKQQKLFTCDLKKKSSQNITVRVSLLIGNSSIQKRTQQTPQTNPKRTFERTKEIIS
jgi:hypothetical protein